MKQVILTLVTSMLAFAGIVALPPHTDASTVVRGRSAQVRPLGTSYRIVDLRGLIGATLGGFTPTAINNSGQIVGYDGGTAANGNAGAAYLINADGSVVKFDRTGVDGALYVPTAISNSGKSVVGRAISDGNENGIATWIGSTKAVTQNYVSYFPVGPLPDIASGTVAIAGEFFYGFPAFSYNYFPSRGCRITDFQAQAINDSGTIVGSGLGYAAYGSTTACAVAVPLPHPANGSTQAHAINSAGDLIGSFTGPGAPAFGAEYFVKGTRFYRIPLPAAHASDGTYLEANAIGDDDEVVGNILSQTPPFAPVAPFLYRSGMSVDVNALLPAQSGWTLLTASGVRTGGEIVGTGYHNGILSGYALQPQ